MASYVFFQNPAKENLTFLVDVHWHFHAVIVDFQWDCRPLFVSFLDGKRLSLSLSLQTVLSLEASAKYTVTAV